MRGIVRASGAACFELLWPLLGNPARDRGVRPARLRADGLDVACLVLVFPGPHSYTGEDPAETQPPGNPALLERVREACRERAAAWAKKKPAGSSFAVKPPPAFATQRS